MTTLVREALAGEVALDERVDERARTYARTGVVPEADAAPPEVRVDNEASGTSTVIEVYAPDAVGILYRLTKALNAVDLDIRTAKVQTLGPRVVDSFYVRTAKGDKVTDPAALVEVESAILVGPGVGPGWCRPGTRDGRAIIGACASRSGHRSAIRGPTCSTGPATPNGPAGTGSTSPTTSWPTCPARSRPTPRTSRRPPRWPPWPPPPSGSGWPPSSFGITYRHPAVLAKWAATIDHISGGRLLLGLGAGWQENEHAAVRHPPRPAGRAGRALRGGAAGDPGPARRADHDRRR